MNANENKLTFKDAYEFPLSLFLSTKVMTVTHNMAFDFIPSFFSGIKSIQVSQADREKFVRIVNGADEKMETQVKFTYKDGTIYYDDLALIWIRGWGHLIGVGGMHLSPKTAERLQDEFGNFIIERITKNQNIF